MIPEHVNGRLPKGIHHASWTEFVDRFGTSPRRRALLNGLFVALHHLFEAGCSTAYVGGSFVTAKVNPKDTDVVWDIAGVTDPDLVHKIFLGPAGLPVQRALFGGEFFPSHIVEGASGLPFVEFFQQTRSGQAVGIVAIDLETLDD